MRSEFIAALDTHKTTFGVELSPTQTNRLANYFELVMEHNPLLHLVGPCTPEEFAVRHILESLTLLQHLPKRAAIADVGTGAGLPSLPCLLVRGDLQAILIETKEKKTKFLAEVCEKLDVTHRIQIANRQFEETDISKVFAVTCRALDKFTDKLPRIIKWTKGKPLLFFGGNNLADALDKNRVKFKRRLMPMSEQRFLFVSNK